MGKIIVSHETPEYVEKRNSLLFGKNNGAYWYSREICENIAPKVKTSRPWVTLNLKGQAADHAIVFIHRNTEHEANLGWLREYKDLVLVVSSHVTERWANESMPEAKCLFLPLSVDTAYVKQFMAEKKNRDTCYAGNRWFFQAENICRNVPYGTPKFTNLEREELLQAIAPYKKCYAIGRTALEAKILGCQILPFDDRYPNPEFWQVYDNAEAAIMLQDMLNEIDHK